MYISSQSHPVTHSHHAHSKVAAPSTLTSNTPPTDPFSTAAASTSAASSSLPTTTAQADSTQDNFEEAFARMKVDMQSTSATTASSASSSTDANDLASATSALTASTSPLPASFDTSSSSSTDSDAVDPTTGMTSVQQQFKSYMDESPAQKVQDSMLAQLGLTKAQFDQMPPAQKLNVEHKMAEMLKEKMGGSKDGTAVADSGSSVSGATTTSAAAAV